MTQISSIPQPVVVVLRSAEIESKSELWLAVAQSIGAAVQQAGARMIDVRTSAEWLEAADAFFPVLALIELPLADDWAAAVQRCKLRPHSSAIPVYVFGSYLDDAMMQVARAAGADSIWPTAQLEAEIAALVARCVNPPIVYPEGWDEPLPDLARRGLAEFNRGAYFEQHELLEAAWMAEARPIRQLYQGLLQIGVAFLQIERRNWAGALKMMRRGLPKLRGLPPLCQGIELATFRQTAEEIHVALMELGAAKIAEFDQQRFPRIIFKAA